MKKALITGIGGQDGAYLSNFLLAKGYKIFGIDSPAKHSDNWRLKYLGIDGEVDMISCDITDMSSLSGLIKRTKPDEIYNLAAQSFVKESWASPQLTAQVNAMGVLNVLEAMRMSVPDARFYQASTSEMFGLVRELIQCEETRFHPRSPYGVSKCFGYWITVNYRESFNCFACNGILFNHESPVRDIKFVTRKVTDAVARIKLKKQTELRLGNIKAKRDWGFAGDFVRAMWLMLQQDFPDDYIIATGRTTSVEDMCKIAFNYAGLNYEDYIVIDHRYFRPVDVEVLHGDPTKAKINLGWEASTTLEELICMMVDADLERVKDEYAM